MHFDANAILLAILAVIPSFWAVVLAWRARQEARSVTATEFGTAMAKEAFDSLTEQVHRLDQRRAEAEIERVALTNRIDNLTEVLHITNTYLVTLLQLLDRHGITRPPAPTGLRVIGDHTNPRSGT